MLGSSIIIGGAHVPLRTLDGSLPARVFTWHDTGLQFSARQGFNKTRREPIDLCVWHFTGGEGDPERVWQTLEQRDLGIEFLIARDGAVWQFCDPLHVDTADAGLVNARSVGVEMVSYGVRRAGPRQDGTGLHLPSLWTVPRKGDDRGKTEQVIHGRRMQVANFYPEQLAAALQLADALSSALPAIRRRVPIDHETGAVLPTALSPAALDRFTGHIGHYQVTRRKVDPGVLLLEQMRAHFDAAERDEATTAVSQ